MDTIEINNINYSISDILSPTFFTEGFESNAIKAIQFIKSWHDPNHKFSVLTSGTTGLPKLINISRDQMVKSAKMTARAVGLKADDTALVCLNTSFIGGMMMMARGLTLNLNLTVAEPSANPFSSLGSNRHFDFLALVPLQLQNIVNDPKAIKSLNNARIVLIGGAPISNGLLQRIKSLKPMVYSTYGMTETISHIALKPLNGIDASSYFSVLPEVTIGQDSRGCLTITSPTTNKETIVTNDCVHMIDGHSFEWLGRVDNVVNSGGIKIHLEQLEYEIEVLLAGLTIDESFFIAPVEDDYFGQYLVLYIEGNQKDSDLIMKHLKHNLGYRAPKEIQWKKSFQRTQTGKIDRENTL